MGEEGFGGGHTRSTRREFRTDSPLERSHIVEQRMSVSRAKTVDVLIVGGGPAGAWSAHALLAAGRRVLLVDDPLLPAAWRAAVGLLNPVRGRRFTLAWRAREAFATAAAAYGALPLPPGCSWIIRPVSVRRPCGDRIDATLVRRRADALCAAGFPARFDHVASGNHTLEVAGAWVVDTHAAMAALRLSLEKSAAWLDDHVAPHDLEFRDRAWHWPSRGIVAETLLLAGGATQLGHPALDRLSLVPVKGESIAVAFARSDTTPRHVLADEHHLAPQSNGHWLCGGTKRPGTADSRPTREGREELERFLRDHACPDWSTVGHFAGVRAVARDRLPVVGRLPGTPSAYVLQGLGSQGIAYAPWVSELLTRHMVDGTSLPAEIAAERFDRERESSGVSRCTADALEHAHAVAASLLGSGARAIDLTCGNGGDTLRLARLVGPTGRVFAVDVQPGAVATTDRRLRRHGVPDTGVRLAVGDHAEIAALVPPEFSDATAVIFVSLGRLAGVSSPIRTRVEKTRAALVATLALLRVEGAAIVVAPHGDRTAAGEFGQLRDWAASLDPKSYRCESWPNHVSSRESARVLVVRRLGARDDHARPD
jgi:glycine/D-amino acid oxidase-like deaminating enzyme/precorrin-6B methylase 2